MFTNSGLSEAPPTRKPSTSGWVAKNDMSMPHIATRMKAVRQTKLLAVRCSDTAAVNYTRVLRNRRRHCFGEEAANVDMRLLGLGRGGDLACAYGPDGLVCNHDLTEAHRTMSTTNAGGN